MITLLLLQALELGPLVGGLSHEDARIWVKADGPATFAVRWGRREDLSDAKLVQGPKLESATAFAGQLRLQGTAPAALHHYEVLLDGKTPGPRGTFTTPPLPGTKGSLRFAFTSCAGKTGKEAEPAWNDLAGRSFDLHLMLGDNHYADSTDPEKLRAAYASHRAVPSFLTIARRTPTLGIWDDHDYGPDNSDGSTPGKERSLQVFRDYWANPGSGEAENPGIYFRFSWGDVEFFMIDVRYHRTPNKAPEDGTKTMLGRRQLAWLKEAVRMSKATFKVLASGSEWQTNTQPDCWKSFLRERDELFDALKDVTGLLLISGDRHFTGGYQIGGRFLEITTGPVGSKNFPTKNLPEMFLNHGEGKLYTIFELESEASPPRATLEVYRAGEGLIEKRRFTWDEINGAAKLPLLPVPAK